MEKPKEQLKEQHRQHPEPLRRLLTPQQLGFWTFFILFWAIVFHYFFTHWKQNDYCIYTAPDKTQILLKSQECPAKE